MAALEPEPKTTPEPNPCVGAGCWGAPKTTPIAEAPPTAAAPSLVEVPSLSALPSLAAAQAASSAELERQAERQVERLAVTAREAMAPVTAREAMALSMALVAASASESACWRGEAAAAVHARRATEEVANEKARRAAAEVARWKAEAEAAQQAVARAEAQAGMTPGGGGQEAYPRRLSDYAAGLPNLPLLPSLWPETPQYKPRTAGRMALDMAPPATATALALDSLPPYRAPSWAPRPPAAPSSSAVVGACSAYTGLGAPYGADVLSAEAVAREVMRSIDLAAEQLSQAEMRANACVGFATPTPPSAAAQLLPVRSAGGGEAAGPVASRDAPSSTPCVSMAPPSPDLNGFTPNAAAGVNARPAAERLDDELMRIDNEIAKLQQALQTASTTEGDPGRMECRTASHSGV